MSNISHCTRMEFCTSGKKGSTLWPKLMPFKQDLIIPLLVSFQGEVNKDSKKLLN